MNVGATTQLHGRDQIGQVVEQEGDGDTAREGLKHSLVEVRRSKARCAVRIRDQPKGSSIGPRTAADRA